jgi:UDP-glucose 4-epimerase
MRVLIVGGAGYIGSHLVHALLKAGHEAIVVDNFSSGHREVLPPHVPLFSHDMGLMVAMEEALRQYPVDGCVLCAMLHGTYLSLQMPFSYYHNNFVGTFYLLQSLLRKGVKRILFRSSLRVYGSHPSLPIGPHSPRSPDSPLGKSLCHCEDLLRDLSKSDGLNCSIFRLGSVGGAMGDGSVGAWPNARERMVATAMDVAYGSRDFFYLRGSKLPTADGTPKLELLHVCDVVDAFLQALLRMDGHASVETYNLGTGTPLSVGHFLRRVEEITHRTVTVRELDLLPGYPVEMCVDPRHVAEELRWNPQKTLDQIIHDAWQWRRCGAEKLGRRS